MKVIFILLGIIIAFNIFNGLYSNWKINNLVDEMDKAYNSTSQELAGVKSSIEVVKNELKLRPFTPGSDNPQYDIPAH